MHISHPSGLRLQVKFTTECPAQGNRNYIPVSDLYGRNFTDANGEFQLELSIGHVRTLYDTEFRVPTSLTSRLMHHHHQIQNPHNTTTGNALQHQYGSASPRGSKCKLETSYFTFGGFDWNLALYPHGVKDVSCKYGQILITAHYNTYNERKLPYNLYLHYIILNTKKWVYVNENGKLKLVKLN